MDHNNSMDQDCVMDEYRIEQYDWSKTELNNTFTSSVQYNGPYNIMYQYNIMDQSNAMDQCKIAQRIQCKMSIQ